MKYKIKVDDIDNFLRQNGYLWIDREATVNDGDYFFEVNDNILYDEFYDDSKLKLEVVLLTKENHNISAIVCCDDLTFTIQGNNHLSEKNQIDLSKKWVKYLLENYKEYANFLYDWYTTEKKEVCAFYDDKIKQLEEQILDCKKQCVDRVEKLNEYNKILVNYSLSKLRKEKTETKIENKESNKIKNEFVK